VATTGGTAVGPCPGRIEASFQDEASTNWCVSARQLLASRVSIRRNAHATLDSVSDRDGAFSRTATSVVDPRLGRGEVKCEMKFNLKGWSAIYKTAKGEGTIQCDDGQSMAVSIKVTGGGLTFGKSETKNGIGKFSEAAKIDDLLGAYAAAQAEPRRQVGRGPGAHQGDVSLALSGTGSGWDLGISGAKFTITKR